MYFFDTGFRVRACLFGSGFRDKDVSFTGSGFRVTVLTDWLVSCSSCSFYPIAGISTFLLVFVCLID